MNNRYLSAKNTQLAFRRLWKPRGPQPPPAEARNVKDGDLRIRRASAGCGPKDKPNREKEIGGPLQVRRFRLQALFRYEKSVPPLMSMLVPVR